MRWLAFTFMFLSITAQSVAQATASIPMDQQSIDNGRKIYEEECSRCHLFGEQKLGPSLASITDKRPTGWLLGFIQNSQAFIQSGDDPYARYLFQQYNHMVMPEFQHLTEQERLDILAFIADFSAAQPYSLVADSMNYYDEDILTMAKNRAVQKDATETDYYTNSSAPFFPDDLQTIQQGEALYKAQCQTCHELGRRKTGPALASVTDRLPLNWLLDFIDSPKRVLESGDDYANFLVTKYPLVMPDFDFLDREDKMAVLAYIRFESGAPTHIAGANANKILEDSNGTALTSKHVDRPKPDQEGVESYPLLKVVGVMLVILMVIVIGVVVWRVFKA